MAIIKAGAVVPLMALIESGNTDAAEALSHLAFTINGICSELVGDAETDADTDASTDIE